MPLDIDALGAELAAVVAAQLKPLQKEIADLRAELAVVKQDKAIVPELPDVQGLIDKGIAEAVAAIPAPTNGKDCDMDAVMASLQELVKAMPAPKDGRDGVDGKDGKDGADGKEGAQGEKGIDGTGMAGAILDRDGCLQITLTNGEVKNLGVVVGKDGVSLESFTMEYLEETHEVCIKGTCGTRTQEIRYPAGGVQLGGYWRDGTKSKSCEAWVHDGSLWIAKRDTTSKPETKSDDWVLAARKGRDVDPNLPPPAGTIKVGPASK